MLYWSDTYDLCLHAQEDFLEALAELQPDCCCYCRHGRGRDASDLCLQEDFLEALAELQPDLCVTAAYGNYLPKRFLEIPKYGTVNIHPSLLPKYRGAAPVQRAIQVRLTSQSSCTDLPLAHDKPASRKCGLSSH